MNLLNSAPWAKKVKYEIVANLPLKNEEAETEKIDA